MQAVDLSHDLAVLGVPDTQTSKEAGAFEEYLETVAPVALCAEEFPPCTPFSVHIHAHTRRWVKGRAEQGPDGSLIMIEAEAAISGGTSGGPVVTDSGRLLGLVSTVGVGAALGEVILARLHLTAPGYLVRLMRDPMWVHRRNRKMWAERQHEAEA